MDSCPIKSSNFITIIIPYMPCDRNDSLKFTLDKFLSTPFYDSLVIQIHVQITFTFNHVFDHCLALLKQYQKLFSKQFSSVSLSFHYCHDDGVYDAINIAVRNCNSQYVSICGAGDYFYLNTIHSFLSCISFFLI